jgi:probable rRNA maturation factor
LKITIYNQAVCCISSRIKEKINALVEFIIKEERATFNDLNIIITNDKYMNELNKKFLRINKPTNVLSFHMEEVSEIYISYDRVDNPDDLLYYITHGLLHMIGYDHSEAVGSRKMEKKCHQYLSYITEKEE